METASLVILCVIAALTTTGQPPYSTGLEAVLSLLVLVPVICFGGYVVYHKVG